MRQFGFKVLHKSRHSNARVGQITTPHGVIDTPGFVAVGTNGTLKALDNVTVDALGLQLMFCNTYHLLVQPGPKLIQQCGGLHKFINRKNPLITDSGGFQVFSLAYGSVKDELKSRGQKTGNPSVLKITEEGVLFRSYKDGSPILLTPETSIAAQKALGADIIIPFDELPPYHISQEKLTKSLERTHRWEKRSLEAHLKHKNNQAMYGVIHGGIDPTLRKQSSTYLTNLPFDGFAIGGSVGKNKKEMVQLISQVRPTLPDDKPNHLLGIGDIDSLQRLIPLGIDTFDSSYPTKAARHGLLFTKEGHVKILQSKYKMAFEPIDQGCACPTCQHFSLAYLHHLFKAKELTAYTLASQHNLYFMVQLMKAVRAAILDDRL